MIVAGTTYESVLLVLKIAFLVLLYLFIWRIVRTAGRDLRLPQESFILRPAIAGGAIGQSINPGRLVVLQSQVLKPGEEFKLDASPLTVGRGTQNDVSIEGFIVAPKIMGDRVGLHPLTIIVAVLIGTTLLGGILGGILAIPVTAALRVVMFRYIWKERQTPVETVRITEPAA